MGKRKAARMRVSRPHPSLCPRNGHKGNRSSPDAEMCLPSSPAPGFAISTALDRARQLSEVRLEPNTCGPVPDRDGASNGK